MLVLVLTSISSLWLAPAVSAQQTVVVTDPGDQDILNPGDDIQVGFQVSVPDAGSTETSVSITGAVLQLSYSCADGGSQTITINAPAQIILAPANYTGWNPTSTATYVAEWNAPSNFCGGKGGRETGGISTFNYQCGDQQGHCHEVCFRHHHRHHHRWGTGWGWGANFPGPQGCIPRKECLSPQKANCCHFY
jgi:hypothetical protein